MIKRDRVLVTGANGFVGRHLCSSLQEAQVTRWDRMDENGRPIAHMELSNPANRKPLLAAVQLADQVYHLAGNANVAAHSEPKIIVEHLQAAAEVLSACFISTRPLVVVSSAYAKGANTSYGLTKALIEQMCADYRRKGLPVSVARLYNVYGPGQERANTYQSAVVPNLYRRFKGSDFSLLSPRSKRDFVYIDDVVAALKLIMMTGPGSQGLYEVGGGEMVEIAHVAKIMALLMGYHGPIGESEGAQMEEHVPYLSTTVPFRAVTVSLEEGLKRTIAHLDRVAA